MFFRNNLTFLSISWLQFPPFHSYQASTPGSGKIKQLFKAFGDSGIWAAWDLP
jgi:hypothetical protein